jgi:hypothetical protein
MPRSRYVETIAEIAADDSSLDEGRMTSVVGFARG